MPKRLGGYVPLARGGGGKPTITTGSGLTGYRLRDRLIVQKLATAGQVEARYRLYSTPGRTAVIWDSGLRPDTGDSLEVWAEDCGATSGGVRYVGVVVRVTSSGPSAESDLISITYETAAPTAAQAREAQ